MFIRILPICTIHLPVAVLELPVSKFQNRLLALFRSTARSPYQCAAKYGCIQVGDIASFKSCNPKEEALKCPCKAKSDKFKSVEIT